MSGKQTKSRPLAGAADVPSDGRGCRELGVLDGEHGLAAIRTALRANTVSDFVLTAILAGD